MHAGVCPRPEAKISKICSCRASGSGFDGKRHESDGKRHLYEYGKCLFLHQSDKRKQNRYEQQESSYFHRCDILRHPPSADDNVPPCGKVAYAPYLFRTYLCRLALCRIFPAPEDNRPSHFFREKVSGSPAHTGIHRGIDMACFRP